MEPKLGKLLECTSKIIKKKIKVCAICIKVYLDYVQYTVEPRYTGLNSLIFTVFPDLPGLSPMFMVLH